MIQLKPDQYTLGSMYGSAEYAGTVSINCHSCGKLVTISFANHVLSDPHKIITANGPCPSCKKPTTQITLYGERPIQVYVHPDSTKSRNKMNGSYFPSEALKRSYDSVKNTYNNGEYISAAASCRRTLEGILKGMVPLEKKKLPLNDLIKEVEKIGNQTQITQISHALRMHGNLAAHFEEDHEPTQNEVEGMIELFEFLITYFYILPKDLERMNAKFQKDKT